METGLLRVGKIEELKFFDNWNSDMNKAAIKLHDILTSQSIKEFYDYFCYKLMLVQKNSL